MIRRVKTCAGLLLSVVISLANSMGLADDEVVAQPPSFEQDILPLLAKKCHACHGSDDQQAQLDLRTLSEIMRGGENGPALSNSMAWYMRACSTKA